ncbi:hypothetical protein PN36_04370 [Candidatus Thiomargarita nelsonii]|uniref:Sulfotransferase n=1 Tax=Candidatus Thiomargarita nelsonii TaxID=1003181 RepID=A0A0A6P7N6_9GAMM|nr:hypothetical protein PN36_04370 [Candidatus Thiomargarita nelsonii]
MKRFDIIPDFLGIGANRSGSTWLWRNLKEHPDIWMPPKKEIHYFDRSRIYPSPSHLASKHFLSRLLGREAHNVAYRKKFLHDLISSGYHYKWKGIRWTLRYYLGTYDDDWYLSLFREGMGKVKGEITPSYSILDYKDVEQIKCLMPNLKIIFIIRNPIDRAWSQIRYASSRGIFKGISLVEMKKFVDDPNQVLRGDYIRTINIWRTCFSKEQIFIGFYDEISRSPENLLRNIFEFIGVDTVKFTDKIYNRINTSPDKEIPEKLKFDLAEKYYEQIKQVSNMLGGDAESWLKQAEKILENNYE